jgi:tyrosinase
LSDTMWPWNGSTTSPRPSFPPPGGGFAADPIVAGPGTSPRVQDMIDYCGAMTPGSTLGFDYDDVPSP